MEDGLVVKDDPLQVLLLLGLVVVQSDLLHQNVCENCPA